VKKKLLLIPLALLLAISLVAIGCPAPEPEEPTPPPTPPPEEPTPPPEEPTPPPRPPDYDTRESIVIGQAVSLSGPNAIIHSSYAANPQEMWVEDVNAKGGLYIEEYGKRLPIETIIYDDKSDHGTLVRLMEKLILEDKVDFLFPPCSTSFLFVAAPVANKYGYILMGAEGGATSLEKLAAEMPYFFAVLNYSNHYQMPTLADIFTDCGVKTVAITFHEDLHGIEYSTVAGTEFALRGIEIVMLKSHPLGIADLSLTLKEAEALNPDAFLALDYPNECILLTKQSMELGINFKAFECNVGPCSYWYRDMFGADAVEGIIGFGAVSPKTSPAFKEYFDKYAARFGEGALDGWAQGFFYPSLQFFEQAVEKAGTLDQAVIRDIIATETFDTLLGPTWFDEKQRLARECHPGQVGQWQNGLWEVIDPGERRTAPPIYPKPEWP
jgi:branched-chain amino acid transport system substrate-binding protein